MNKRLVHRLVAALLAANVLWLPPRGVVAAGEEVNVVVNKANDLADLSVEDARKIFMFDKTAWPGGKHITVLMLASGQTERNVVLREIYRMSPADYVRYFLQAAFTGRIAAPPKDLGSATQMKQSVAQNPGAIGYLRKADVDDTVRVVLKIP